MLAIMLISGDISSTGPPADGITFLLSLDVKGARKPNIGLDAPWTEISIARTENPAVRSNKILGSI
jgi:hypothetical protein